MSKPIYVLNGPNLNLLGDARAGHLRPRPRWTTSAALCEARAAALGAAIVFRQTNHEGELIDWVQEARDGGRRPGDQPGRLRPHLGRPARRAEDA